jgi:pseudoazurin
MKKLAWSAFVFAGLVMAPAAVQARDWQVRMLNRGSAGMMVFEPAYVAVRPGDTVTFVPVDPGHNAESVPGMFPAGAAPFKGNFGQRITVRFVKPGLYGYKCMPHAGLGMVGLVRVGAAVNRAQVQAEAARLPPLARKRMEGFLAQAR